MDTNTNNVYPIAVAPRLQSLIPLTQVAPWGWPWGLMITERAYDALVGEEPGVHERDPGRMLPLIEELMRHTEPDDYVVGMKQTVFANIRPDTPDAGIRLLVVCTQVDTGDGFACICVIDIPEWGAVHETVDDYEDIIINMQR